MEFKRNIETTSVIITNDAPRKLGKHIESLTFSLSEEAAEAWPQGVSHDFESSESDRKGHHRLVEINESKEADRRRVVYSPKKKLVTPENFFYEDPSESEKIGKGAIIKGGVAAAAVTGGATIVYMIVRSTSGKRNKE